MGWILWVIIVGLIAGWAAGKIMGKGGYGPVMDIVLGILGGIVGGFLAPENAPEDIENEYIYSTFMFCHPDLFNRVEEWITNKVAWLNGPAADFD